MALYLDKRAAEAIVVRFCFNHRINQQKTLNMKDQTQKERAMAMTSLSLMVQSFFINFIFA